MTTSVDLADLASSVENLVTAIDNLLDQQIQLYTTTDPTVVISDANGNPFTVPSYYATIGANAAAVNAMQAQVAANTAAIAAIDSGDTTINANILALQTQQTQNTTDISTLKTEMTAVQGAQATDQSNIATLQSQVAALQTGGTGTNSTLTQLQNAVNTNTSNITALQTQQTTNTNNIASLTDTVTAQGTTLTALQSTVTTNGTTLSTVQGSLTTLQTQVNTIQSNQSADEANLSTVQSQVSALNSSVTAIQTQQTTNTDNITALQSSLTTLQTSVNSNTGALTAAQANITTLQTNVATNAAAIGNTQSSLNALTTQVGLLPQPGAYSPPYVSARFFTQVFMDFNGRVIGGISRKTGKLWMNNGGWLSDRLDELEQDVGTTPPSLYAEDFVTNLGSPTYPRYMVQFGTKTPDTSGNNPGGSVQVSSYGGFTSLGDFEWDGGRSLNWELAEARKRSLSKKFTQPAPQRLILGDCGLFVPSGVSGVTPWNSSLATNTTLPGGYVPQPLLVGASDMNSAQLAALIGAQPLLLTVSGHAVAPSTTVALSASISSPQGTPTTVWPITTGLAANIPASGLTGRLGGVNGLRGWVNGVGSAATFQPMATLAATTYIPDNQPFVVDQVDRYLSGTVIIQIGRNDIGTLTAAQIFANIQAIVNAIRTVEKRFLILTPTPYASETNADANGQEIIALEQMVASAYPNNSILTRPALQGIYGNLGNDPTSIFSNGTLPAAWYASDNQTLVTAAQNYIQALVANFLNIRGW